MIVQLALLIFFLLIAGLGPGMVLTCRLRLAPLERLCTSLGLSWIVVYLLATGIYLGGMDWRWTYLFSLLFFICFLCSLPALGRMLRNHAVRRVLLGIILLAIWLGMLLSLVRIYSGGGWAGDWLEHYERTQFFLHHWQPNFEFIDLYLLPARPPMMNLVVAFFLAQVGHGFEAFELCFALLNLCAFLPAALLLNQLRQRGGRGFWFLVVALSASPFFAENLTYTWTKLFAAFFVLLAIALYLRNRRVLAFVMLAAGCLVHYSAAPFALFLALHYLWQWMRKRQGNWRQAATIFLLCAALLASWFAWSIHRYGLAGTIGSTTTISESAKLSWTGNLQKIGLNLYYSIVPPLLGRMNLIYHDQSPLGFVRDLAFTCYQQNLLLMIGSAGAVVAVWIFFRQFRENNRHSWFWIGLIVFCIIGGIATIGDIEPDSGAHAVAHPITLIAIAAVAAFAPVLPRWGLRLLTLGWAVDFALGVWLQVYVENYSFRTIIGLDGQSFAAMPVKLAGVAAQCLHGKNQYYIQFIGDHFGDSAAAILLVLAIAEAMGLLLLLRNRHWLVQGGGGGSGNRRARLRKLS